MQTRTAAPHGPHEAPHSGGSSGPASISRVSPPRCSWLKRRRFLSSDCAIRSSLRAPLTACASCSCFRCSRCSRTCAADRDSGGKARRAAQQTPPLRLRHLPLCASLPHTLRLRGRARAAEQAPSCHPASATSRPAPASHAPGQGRRRTSSVASSSGVARATHAASTSPRSSRSHSGRFFAREPARWWGGRGPEWGLGTATL